MTEDIQQEDAQRDELLRDYKTVLKAHREYINGLSNSEYREYKRRRRLIGSGMEHECDMNDKWCQEGANSGRHPDHDSHITGCTCGLGKGEFSDNTKS